MEGTAERIDFRARVCRIFRGRLGGAYSRSPDDRDVGRAVDWTIGRDGTAIEEREKSAQREKAAAPTVAKKRDRLRKDEIAM